MLKSVDILMEFERKLQKTTVEICKELSEKQRYKEKARHELDATHKSPMGFEQHSVNVEQQPNKWNMLLLLYNVDELMYVPYTGSLKMNKLLQQLDVCGLE
jgi:hypothetical protein